MCSLDFSEEAHAIYEKLLEKGHSASLPYTIQRFLKGESTLEEIQEMKAAGEFVRYVISRDIIRENWERMKGDDAVLVVNSFKKGIENYIGGNTFLEMGFAHIANMKIFLWRDIPNMSYTEEILAMQPIVLSENLDAIQ